MTLEERIERLERALAGQCGSGPAPNPGVMRAKEFIVEDNEGAVRARLSAEHGEPSLKLLDSEGKIQISIEVTDDEPRIVMFDHQGEIGAWLTVDPEGSRLILGMPGCGENAELALDEDGPTLQLFDEQYRLRVQLDERNNGPRLLFSKVESEPCNQSPRDDSDPGESNHMGENTITGPDLPPGGQPDKGPPTRTA